VFFSRTHLVQSRGAPRRLIGLCASFGFRQSTGRSPAVSAADRGPSSVSAFLIRSANSHSAGSMIAVEPIGSNRCYLACSGSQMVIETLAFVTLSIVLDRGDPGGRK